MPHGRNRHANKTCQSNVMNALTFSLRSWPTKKMEKKNKKREFSRKKNNGEQRYRGARGLQKTAKQSYTLRIWSTKTKDGYVVGTKS